MPRYWKYTTLANPLVYKEYIAISDDLENDEHPMGKKLISYFTKNEGHELFECREISEEEYNKLK